MKAELDEGAIHHRALNREFARSRARLATVALILVAVFAASTFGFRAFKPTTPAVAPPILMDATSPSSGMVDQIVVKPGEYVRKGQLLASLDTSHLRSELDQAYVELEAAVAEAQAPPIAMAIQTPAIGMKGGFEKKPVPIQPIPNRGGNMPVLPTVSPRNLSPVSQVSVQPDASKVVADAATKVKGLKDHGDKAQAEMPTLQKELDDAKSTLSSAQALVASAQAVADRTRAERDKNATLLAEGVISASEASKSDAYAMQAQGQLQVAKVKAAQAAVQVGEKQRAIDSAQADIVAASKDLPTAIAALANAKKQALTVRPMVTWSGPKGGLPAASPPAQSLPKFKLVKLKGAITPTPPPQPVKVDFTPPSQSSARLDKAEATLERLKAEFAKSCIYAPESGKISRVVLGVGRQVQPGAVVVVLERVKVK